MAITAFCLWGLLPAYIGLIKHMPIADLTAWRAVFAAIAVIVGMMLTQHLRPALAQIKTLASPAPFRFILGPIITATALGTSWIVLFYCVQINRVVDVALGFFLTPLFIALTGWIVLREKLTPLQWLALAITGSGLLILVLRFEGVPWVPFSIVFCISLYALIRKTSALQPMSALLLESLILVPPALIWLAFGGQFGSLGFSGVTVNRGLDLLLVAGAGIFTIVVMSLWLAASRRLRLTTIGILGYIEPTVTLLVGIWLFNEPLSQTRLLVFSLVWVGMLIYIADLLRLARQQPTQVATS
ncbi:MAG: EamA family transporter RarD [Alphaproteobacteria bacterium]